jgi:four helix bundle protein
LEYFKIEKVIIVAGLEVMGYGFEGYGFWVIGFLFYKLIKNMATINSFEELDIWKKAQELGAMVYRLCDRNLKITKDFSFKDQIKRSALSISNNIAEGFEYNNNPDFHRYLRIAKGSCGEVRNCLLFSIKIEYITKEEVKEEIELSISLSKQIGQLMKYLRLKIAEKKIETKQIRNLQTRNP